MVCAPPCSQGEVKYRIVGFEVDARSIAHDALTQNEGGSCQFPSKPELQTLSKNSEQHALTPSHTPSHTRPHTPSHTHTHTCTHTLTPSHTHLTMQLARGVEPGLGSCSVSQAKVDKTSHWQSLNRSFLQTHA